MNRFLLGLCLVMVCAGLVMGSEVVDRSNLSLKAGPTEPGEQLSLVWVEVFVYPKVVTEDRIVSLGVRTASPVKSVRASFDFNSQPVVLRSSDGLNWSTAYKLGKGAADGVHVARYQIGGEQGAIQRTVEFFVGQTAGLADASEDLSTGAGISSTGWPLTVSATCSAYSGNSTRVLYAGQKLSGLSKLTWYKVVFEDGQEGWVPASQVSDPSEEYCQYGIKAYEVGNYSAAISYCLSAAEADPDSAAAYRWLAKSYLADNRLDAAAEAIQKALRLDDRDIDSRVVADELAKKYYALGHSKYLGKHYSAAVADFRQAVDLRSSLASAWFEMGESLRRLGLESAASDSWREAVKTEPNNPKLATVFKAEKAAVVTAKPAPVAKLVVNDSLNIVKGEKTDKGTAIASAIKSVVALTRSLGTPVIEKGWQVRKMGEKTLVSYLCTQGRGGLESFDWLVDVDTRQVLPHNDNARLLMSRW